MAANKTQCVRLLQALRWRSACSGLVQTRGADGMVGNHLSTPFTGFPPATASVARMHGKELSVLVQHTFTTTSHAGRLRNGTASRGLESSRETGSRSVSQSTRAKCTRCAEVRQHICEWRTAEGVGMRSFRRKRPRTGHPQPGPTQAGSAPQGRNSSLGTNKPHRGHGENSRACTLRRKLQLQFD